MKTKSVGQLWPSMKNLRNLLSAAVLVAVLGQLGSAVSAAPLRVGITPEYPPLVYRQPDGTNGLEIDFAKALGQDLGRPVEFVVLRWDQLMPALLDREIDIIMSGMSVTKARQLKIRFSDPYVRNELRAIFPMKEANRFKTVDDLRKTDAKIGVVAGTTGDVYVKQNCTSAQIVPVTMRRDVATWLLRTKRMDVFVDDSFALADILSKNEADIGFLREPLSEEDLAWGVRPGDTEFLAEVNHALSRWKSDGTLERLLDRWVPYLKNLRVKQSGGETK
jgi:ABC-type amino acid transport substrate-binding protein